jgi:hypothetical protein
MIKFSESKINIVYDLLINVHRFFNMFYFQESQRYRGGSEPRLELFFRLKVNKLKVRARLSLILKSSIELFSVSSPKFII